MMQDYPKTLSPSARVGFTVLDTWIAYSPVKNNSEDATKVPKGNPYHSATSGEMAIYRAHSLIFRKVDYACTPEEVQQHFQSCRTVNRVTILTDKFGQPKGFAYIEFLEQEAIQEALSLNETELHGRQLKKQKIKQSSWIYTTRVCK